MSRAASMSELRAALTPPTASLSSWCPFRRPWETCGYDDAQRADAIERRSTMSCVSAGRMRFDGTEFRRLLAGRTLLMVGDSVHVQFFVALACQLHAQNPSSVLNHTLGWVKGGRVLKKRCHEKKKCHYTQGCIHFTDGFRMCSCFIWSLDKVLYERCLRWYVSSPEDVILYGSIGVHFREVQDLYTQGNSEVSHAAREARMALNTFKNRAFLIWREVSAQHFDSPGGHFNLTWMPEYNRWVGNSTCTPHTLEEMEEHNNGIGSVCQSCGRPGCP